MTATHQLDSLDLDIAAALQVNGRASWRRIATALDAPERTVAAHGLELLRTRQVRLTGITLLPNGGMFETAIAQVRCISGMNRVTATAAAAREDTIFTYLTTGDFGCVFELIHDRSRSLRLLVDELPGLPGVGSIETATVLRHYKAIHQWLPGILNSEQVSMLSDQEQGWEPTSAAELPPLSREEQVIARVLAADGRATVEELARITALSPASARRRLAHMQASGRLFHRALIEPEILGFPVEAMLRIRTVPGRSETVAIRLSRVPEVRYLAFVTGRSQLLVNIACADNDALVQFLSDPEWATDAVEIETSMVLHALKRSQVRLDN